VESSIASAAAALEAVNAQRADNHQQRRALEKDVAAVDTRLARFDDHKAAVKTNQEYQALLHEIATAKAEKDGIEDRILAGLEADESLATAEAAAQAALADARRDGDAARAALDGEAAALEADLKRLAGERTTTTRDVPPQLLARYDQLLKQRRGLAVALMRGELCTACHVRLRPHVAQIIRRNDEIVACESCQRILYSEAPAASSGAPENASPHAGA
jgi:predicted  nucleic acid-binding Zn-ribbon protein